MTTQSNSQSVEQFQAQQIKQFQASGFQSQQTPLDSQSLQSSDTASASQPQNALSTSDLNLVSPQGGSPLDALSLEDIGLLGGLLNDGTLDVLDTNSLLGSQGAGGATQGVTDVLGGLNLLSGSKKSLPLIKADLLDEQTNNIMTNQSPVQFVEVLQQAQPQFQKIKFVK